MLLACQPTARTHDGEVAIANTHRQSQTGVANLVSRAVIAAASRPQHREAVSPSAETGTRVSRRGFRHRFILPGIDSSFLKALASDVELVVDASSSEPTRYRREAFESRVLDVTIHAPWHVCDRIAHVPSYRLVTFGMDQAVGCWRNVREYWIGPRQARALSFERFRDVLLYRDLEVR